MIEILLRAAHSSGSSNLLYVGTDGTVISHSYAKLLQDATQVLAGLQSQGLAPQAKVILQFDSNQQFLTAFWACLLGGLVPVLLPACLHQDPSSSAFQKLHTVWETLDRPYLLTSTRLIRTSVNIALLQPSPTGPCLLIENLREHMEAPHYQPNSPSDLAVLALTSGSTGTAKLVQLSQRNLLSQILGVVQFKNLTVAEVSLNWMPLDHVGSLCTHLRDVYLGCRQLQIETATILHDPLLWIDLLDRYRVTLTRAPNFAYKLVNEQAAEIAQRRWDLSELRFIINAGEAIVAKVARRFLELLAPHGLSPQAMAPCWGMTETSSGVTYSDTFSLEACQEDYTFIDLGAPLPGVALRIVDEQGQLVAEGVTGRLQVGGTILTAGYYQNPTANTEAFTPDGWFDTGDIGFLQNGRLTLTGRATENIILNGVHYHSYEIEALVEEVDGIAASFVAACTVHDRIEQTVDKLAIFFSTTASQTESQRSVLIQAIRQTLASQSGINPHYLIPLPQADFPKTSLGKIQRRRLAQQFAQGSFDELIQQVQVFHPADEYIAPCTDLEQHLAALWQELFKLPLVSVQENFFALGGDSLLAIRFLTAFRHSAQTDLSAYDLFSHPTIAALAEHIQHGQKQEPRERLPAILPVPRVENLPLSFSQQRLWFLAQLQPDSPFYNIPATLVLRGDLKREALEQAMTMLLGRHEALRTTIHQEGEQLWQKIALPSPVQIPLEELAELTETERQRMIRQYQVQEFQRPFNLSSEPLWRARLLHTQAGEHLLLITLHHIITDGWSMDLFWSELAQLYNAATIGTPMPPAKMDVHYADFATWQQAAVRQGLFQSQLAYWQQQLADASQVLELVTDFPRPAQSSFHGSTQALLFPSDLAKKLRTFSQQEQSTLFMTLLAAFQVLLYRYTEQTDILVGTPAANRNQHEVQNVIGSFANPLVIRTLLTDNPSFRILLQQVRETVLQAYDHQELPFEILVESLHPYRDSSRQPIFQAMFVLQETHTAQLQFNDIEATFLESNTQTAKLDLTLFVTETGNGLQISLEYSTDLFEAETIQQMLDHFHQLILSIVSDPDQRVVWLPLFGETEKQRLLSWHTHPTAYPQCLCLQQLFEQQVEATPDQIALSSEKGHLTYAQLNERANRLAHYLRSLHVGPETLVGLCMERSPELIVAILATLKTGGAYVPLDASIPVERLQFMIQDTQLTVILTQAHLRPLLPEESITLIDLDEWPTLEKGFSSANLPVVTEPHHRAYAMYTSGSTGKPKAVEVIHRAIVRLVKGTQYANFSPAETFIQFAPIAFDASTFEIWGALLNGARLFIPSPHLLSLEQIAEVLQQQQVTTLWLTAGLFHQMVEENLEGLRGIRQLLAGGDVLLPRHVRQVLLAHPGCTLINGYGPTENTTFTCTYAMMAPETRPTIPIGRPIANTSVYVLDRYLQPVPAGVAGTLYTGGDGLARGYLNRPNLTAEKFIPDPFSQTSGARMYNTGDRVRYLPDGNLEFLGRTDTQVKLRGFRIELGEIEQALSEHPALAEVAVIVREDQPGEKRLVAYVVPRHSVPAHSELHHYLEASLPAYMLPSFYVTLEALPLSPNGKVDRRQLPPPDWGAQRAAALTEPRTVIEAAVSTIWQEVLEVKPIGVFDNFFDLGGHSLSITRLLSRINKTFRAHLTLHEVFDAPTVAGISERLVAQESKPGRIHKIATLYQELATLPDAEVRTRLQAGRS